MGYPGRDNIYQATIRRMVCEALEERERAFRESHKDDADEVLLDYLRQCAADLGHTPWPEEIDGGALIQERFGSWENAVRAARLPGLRGNDGIQSFARIQQETERQQERYRRRKHEKKLRARKKESERKAKKGMHPPKNGGS